MRVAPVIELTHEHERQLTKLAQSKTTRVRLAQRAGIVLLAVLGMPNKEIADALGVGRIQVGRWRDRFAQAGLAGFERDLPRGAPAISTR